MALRSEGSAGGEHPGPYYPPGCSLLLRPFSDPDSVRGVRRDGIGSSDIPAVLGICPPSWGSPFTLYHRKRGVLPDVDTDAMRWGRRLEAAVADEFADRHPEFTVSPAGVYAHRDRFWQRASPDRLLYEVGAHARWYRNNDNPPAPVSVLEIKTAGSWDGWGEPGTDEIPVYYRAQVLWQMDVLGVTEARVAVLVAGQHYREYVVAYHPDDVAVMVAAGEEFWRRVQSGDEPPVDWTAATAATLRHLHPTVVDTDVEIPERLARAYRQTRVHHDRISRHLGLLANQVLDLIGDGRRAVCDGERVATRSVSHPRRIDVRRLREEIPDVAEHYTYRCGTCDGKGETDAAPCVACNGTGHPAETRMTAAPLPKPHHRTVRSALA